MSVEEEHMRLLMEKTAWDVYGKAREGEDERIAAAVAKGMKAALAEYGVKGEHLIWLRLQYQQEKENWGIVRKTFWAVVLAAVLTFGWNAAYEYLLNKALAAEQQRGHQSRPSNPTSEGQ